MISVSDADAILQQHALKLPADTVLLTDANGRILREPIRADRDFPPFDRVAMDGIAFRFADYQANINKPDFQVVGRHLAGQPAPLLPSVGVCMEVMTGAMMPVGADTVVPYEQIRLENGRALLQTDAVEKGQFVHRQATDRRKNDTLLPASTRIGAAEIAVAAAVGHAQLSVSGLPRVAIIATGDELVDVSETPMPYQIRRSNGYFLATALQSLRIHASLHHIPDDKPQLKRRLSALLAEHDMLLISGGVSAGKADFVPEILSELAVRQHFHQVAQRPGKPLWFGTTDDQKAVFGLPGNPVSTVLCAIRYVLPFLQRSMGMAPVAPLFAQVADEITFKPALTYFVPIRLTGAADGRMLAAPLPGSGSADFANLTAADAFMELPAHLNHFQPGNAYRIWPIR